MLKYPPPHIGTNKANGMDLANRIVGSHCSALWEPLASEQDQWAPRRGRIVEHISSHQIYVRV